MTRVPPYVRKEPGGPIELMVEGGKRAEVLEFDAACRLMQGLVDAIMEARDEQGRQG